MFMRGLHAAALSAFAIAGCADGSAPLDPAASLSHLAAVGHAVIGSGHVDGAAGLREFTYHAIQHPDAGVSGSYKIVLPNGLFFEADVSCLAVEGNTGWVAGVIRATNAGIVVIGSTSMFYAIDNGEGSGAPADIVSLAAFNMPGGVDLEFCHERPLLLAPLEITGGNVQVR